jgi:lipopolysaccharide export system protein LptC
MTVQADLIRTKRRRFATPGGSFDRLVRTLAVALPAGVGVLAAIMVFSPLSPRGEVSFLLDRNKVAVVDDRHLVAMTRAARSRSPRDRRSSTAPRTRS